MTKLEVATHLACGAAVALADYALTRSKRIRSNSLVDAALTMLNLLCILLIFGIIVIYVKIKNRGNK